MFVCMYVYIYIYIYIYIHTYIYIYVHIIYIYIYIIKIKPKLLVGGLGVHHKPYRLENKTSLYNFITQNNVENPQVDKARTGQSHT